MSASRNLELNYSDGLAYGASLAEYDRENHLPPETTLVELWAEAHTSRDSELAGRSRKKYAFGNALAESARLNRAYWLGAVRGYRQERWP